MEGGDIKDRQEEQRRDSKEGKCKSMMDGKHTWQIIKKKKKVSVWE